MPTVKITPFPNSGMLPPGLGFAPGNAGSLQPPPPAWCGDRHSASEGSRARQVKEALTLAAG